MSMLEYNVNEADVNEIQMLNYKVEGMLEVTKALIESYAADDGYGVLESPVFNKYQEMIANEKCKLNRLKAALADKYIPKDVLTGNSVKWELDYYTLKLKVNIAD